MQNKRFSDKDVKKLEAKKYMERSIERREYVQIADSPFLRVGRVNVEWN